MLLVGKSTVAPSSAVFLYRAGTLVLRDAPRYWADDYGWGYYTLNAIAWSAEQGEFLGVFAGSPSSLYRFGTGAERFTDVAALSRVTDVGLIDAGGEIVTNQGNVLDAASLSVKRSLNLGPFGLSDCRRLDSRTTLCGINSSFAWYPPFLALFDHASGAYLGTYRPRISQIANGCPEAWVNNASLGLDDRVSTSMGNGRSLVSVITDGRGSRCALHVWTLRGIGAN